MDNQENLSGAFDEQEYLEIQFDKDFSKFVESKESDFKKWEDDYLNNRADTEDELQLYAEYIMNNCNGDKLICNGDMLISAMESGYLLDSFIDSRYEKDCQQAKQ